MHKSGVVLVWFVALTAVGAVMLTSKMLDVRGSWLRAVEKNKAQIEKNDTELESKEAENKELRSQLTRLMLGWNRYWDAKVTVNQQTGEIQLGIGGNQGLGSAQEGDEQVAQAVIFAFQPDPNSPAKVSYVGAFRVNALEPNVALLIPVTPPQPGEVATWKNGTWRLRALVPSQFISALRTLRDDLVERNQQIKRKEDRIQDLNRLMASAKQRLDARVNELIGSDKAPQDEILPVELRKGLVAGLEEEQIRNQEFQVTDRLRRDLLNVYQKQRALIDEVSNLTKKLPKEKE